MDSTDFNKTDALIKRGIVSCGFLRVCVCCDDLIIRGIMASYIWCDDLIMSLSGTVAFFHMNSDILVRLGSKKSFLKCGTEVLFAGPVLVAGSFQLIRYL